MNIEGTVRGLIIAGAYATGTIVLDSQTALPIGTWLGLVGGVWYLSARLARMEESNRHIEQRFSLMEQRLMKLESQLIRVSNQQKGETP